MGTLHTLCVQWGHAYTSSSEGSACLHEGHNGGFVLWCAVGICLIQVSHILQAIFSVGIGQGGPQQKQKSVPERQFCKKDCM